MLEKNIQLAICEYLDWKRHCFWRQNTSPIFDKDTGFYRPMPKYSKKGMPDIVVIKDGKYIGLEVKREKGKQSDVQIQFQKDIEKAGASYYIVTSIDEVKELGL